MKIPPSKLLKKIAGRLSGIHEDDLTTAERQITDLLLDNDILHKDDQGNLLDEDAVRSVPDDRPIPGDGRDAMLDLRRFSPLHDECGESDHIEAGIARALADLYNCNGNHPARIAGLALEDCNHHNEAAILFGMSTGRTMTEPFGRFLQATLQSLVTEHEHDDPYAALAPGGYNGRSEDACTLLFMAFVSNFTPEKTAGMLAENKFI